MLYGVNDVSLLTGKTTWMEIQDALLSRAEYIAVKHTIGFNKIICSKQNTVRWIERAIKCWLPVLGGTKLDQPYLITVRWCHF